MKYQTGKLKTEHSLMKEFVLFLRLVEANKLVKRIIPGRISRQQKGTGKLNITFSYFTESGLKYMMKKGGTAQEVFIICNEENKQILFLEVEDILKNNNF
ncbi:MAG: DUF2103 domain-containing protein [Candidatus Absconditabacteria bacterium]